MPIDAVIEVRHNAAASRFEATVDGLLCVANYHRVENVMRIHHTEVPRALAGRGIAGRIVGAALAHAEANGSGDFSPLWSGQNASGCRAIPAAELTRQLAGGLR